MEEAQACSPHSYLLRPTRSPVAPRVPASPRRKRRRRSVPRSAGLAPPQQPARRPRCGHSLDEPLAARARRSDAPTSHAGALRERPPARVAAARPRAGDRRAAGKGGDARGDAPPHPGRSRGSSAAEAQCTAGPGWQPHQLARAPVWSAGRIRPTMLGGGDPRARVCAGVRTSAVSAQRTSDLPARTLDAAGTIGGC